MQLFAMQSVSPPSKLELLPLSHSALKVGVRGSGSAFTHIFFDAATMRRLEAATTICIAREVCAAPLCRALVAEAERAGFLPCNHRGANTVEQVSLIRSAAGEKLRRMFHCIYLMLRPLMHRYI